MEDEPATLTSTVAVRGALTGIVLLVVMVLRRVLRAIKISGYRSRLNGSGLNRRRTEPTCSTPWFTLSVLTGEIAIIINFGVRIFSKKN